MKDCTSKEQTVVVEHKGCPEIIGRLEDIEFCIPNLKETELDEFGQTVNIDYLYGLNVTPNGYVTLILKGRYDGK